MRAILDTSVLLGPAFDAQGDELAISVITLAELNFGVLVARDGDTRSRRLHKLSSVIRQFDPLPVDDAVAETYGRVAAAVQRAGRQPRARAFDLVIAATAITHGARLYTRNAKDFGGLEKDLDVVALT